MQAALLLEPEGSANQLVLQIAVVVGSGYMEFVKRSVGGLQHEPWSSGVRPCPTHGELNTF